MRVMKCLRQDSTRWNVYKPRPGDVVIVSYPKCGTTWLENIVYYLKNDVGENLEIDDQIPWIEYKYKRDMSGLFHTQEDLYRDLEANPGMRQIKTHLPASYMPVHNKVNYLVIGRDMRDACISWRKHGANFGWHDLEGSISKYWRQWIKNPNFTDNINLPGFDGLHPYIAFYADWWKLRHRENVHLLHFNDLKTNFFDTVSEVAQFIGVSCHDEKLVEMALKTNFSSMKNNAGSLLSSNGFFKGDVGNFFHSGEVGGWKKHLDSEDLELYESLKRSQVDDCEFVNWMETGHLHSIATEGLAIS